MGNSRRISRLRARPHPARAAPHDRADRGQMVSACRLAESDRAMCGIRFLMSVEIGGRLARAIRTMANHGRSASEIAAHYGLDALAVRRFLRRPLSKDRWAKGTARPIIGPIARRVRVMIDKGWNDQDIAAALELDPQRVRDFIWRLEPVRRGRLVRPRGRVEQD